MLLRAGADVEVSHITKEGKKSRANKTETSSSTKGKSKGKQKASGTSSDCEQNAVEPEDEGNGSGEDWVSEEDSNMYLGKSKTPKSTIKTRLQSNYPEVGSPYDTDDEEVDELDPTPPSSQAQPPPRDTKRKLGGDELSPSKSQIPGSTSQFLSQVTPASPSKKQKKS